MRIQYISNLRIATTKAHGYAIMKMCSELAAIGHEVELIVPRRVGYKDNAPDPFTAYKLSRNFSIKKVFCFDLLGRTVWLGRLFFWIDYASFLLALSWSCVLDRSAVFYTRDFLTLLFLPSRPNIFLELHNVPRSQILFRRLIKKPAGFIVISHGLKNELIRLGVHPDKIFVAPSGVDLADLEVKISAVEAKRRLGLDSNSKVAMYIGLLDEWKGYQTLLEASNILPENVTVAIIGGGEDQIALLKIKYPRAVFLGFRPYAELAENQKAADVLVIPNSGKLAISKYYTSPLKLFSHMASGVPIAASDLPSLREVLNESNCVFFTPDNPFAAATAISKILEDPALGQRLASQAVSDVQQYSWKDRARLVTEFVESLEG